MSYMLEDPREFERLEQQAALDAYSPDLELRQVLLRLAGTAPARILDAGCGSGVATRYLAERFPAARVFGCDASPPRVEQAALGAAHLHAEFFVQDLTQPIAQGPFDFILCRYVLEHVPFETSRRIVQQLADALAPGGTLCLIDADGLMVNHYPMSPFLEEMVARWARNSATDITVGRKMPAMLRDAGLCDTDWNIVTLNFKGAALASERALMEQRMEQARQRVEQAMGVENAARFCHDFIESLAQPGAVLFYNKFIVTARKPT